MLLLVAALATAPAVPAEPAPPAPASPPAAPTAEPPPAGPTPPSDPSAQSAPPPALDPALARLDRLEQRLKRVERENRSLRQEVETLREDQDEVSGRVDRIMPLTGRLGGYVDLGFFHVAGDGSGIRADTGHRHFPEYAGVVPDSWTFMGDPLSTAINARGEPADTGPSRAVTFDSVDSKGKSSFILNSLNLNLLVGLGKQVSMEGLVAFVPRSRDVRDPDAARFALGDFVDVKLGYVRWQVPVKRLDFDLYAGKIDPAFGYEYRIQESPTRVGVTPSLICRYTCGRPLGLKARFKFLARRSLILALSVTNGSSFTENFGFTNEIDTNNFKTATGRLAYVIPLGAGLEIGASGLVGAQDFQASERVLQKQYGVDLHLAVKRVDLAGEFVHGEVDGATEQVACDLAPCLLFKGAYGTLGVRATNWLMPYARVDWREATHRQGSNFVYNSNGLRVTPGLRFEIGAHVIFKAEYSVNVELGRLPQFRNDVFTSSLVARM